MISFALPLGILFIVFGLVLGFPVGNVFLLGAIIVVAIIKEPLGFIAGAFYSSLNNYVMMGAGLFIYAGFLLTQAGLADRIVRFSYALVGKVKGGMILVGIVSTFILSALTGSAMTCVSATVPLLVDRLAEYGYQKRYTTAVLCASSFLGYLIPPSVTAMFYCLISQQSVAALFLATIPAGCMIAFGYGVLNYVLCNRYINQELAQKKEEVLKNRWREIKASTFVALPALGVPLVILVGIYGGFFTPNEAGAVAVTYTFFVGVFVYRELNLRKIFFATKNAVITLGMITLLLGAGTVFTRLMIREGIAQALTIWVMNVFHTKIFILLFVNLFLLFLGMVMDETPVMILVVPLLLPLMKELNVNLVHFGVIAILNLGIAIVTPPYAAALFLGARVSGVKYIDLVKPVIPFILLVAIPVLVIVTFFPVFSCWLPEVVLGPEFVGTW